MRGKKAGCKLGKIPENRFLLVCYTYGIKQLQLTQYSDHDHLHTRFSSIVRWLLQE